MTEKTSNTIKHLLYGPDGNRRYAREKGISFAKAYDIDAKKIVEVVKWCFEDHPVEELSLGILEEYNLERPLKHIKPLKKFVIDFIGYLCKSDVVRNLNLQVRIVGELEKFFEHYKEGKKELNVFLKEVANHQGKKINILSPYNGSKELKRAWQRCNTDGVSPTFENLSLRWSISPVTLFIRTGQPNGYNRLSDYFPGIERARLISTPTYPQELTREELNKIIYSFLTLKDRY